MSQTHTIALLGGPSSGKTTFLGRLAGELDLGRIEHLAQHELATDNTAFERLAEPFEDGRFPDRTGEGQALTLDLTLTTRAGLPESTLRLHAADHKGEEVEKLFHTDRNGSWTSAWRDRAEASAILLFIRPEVSRPFPSIAASPDENPWAGMKSNSDTGPTQGIVGEGRIGRSTGPDSVFGPGLKAESKQAHRSAQEGLHIPTEVSAIEVVQFLRHERGLAPGERPKSGSMRVIVLLSAWDEVDERWRRDEKGPQAYLQEEFALLDDFLWSNFHSTDVVALGLSSTGGDLRKSEASDDFLETVEDRNPGYVQYNDGRGRTHTCRDLGLPLYWALRGEDALRLVAHDVD